MGSATSISCVPPSVTWVSTRSLVFEPKRDDIEKSSQPELRGHQAGQHVAAGVLLHRSPCATSWTSSSRRTWAAIILATWASGRRWAGASADLPDLLGAVDEEMDAGDGVELTDGRGLERRPGPLDELDGAHVALVLHQLHAIGDDRLVDDPQGRQLARVERATEQTDGVHVAGPQLKRYVMPRLRDPCLPGRLFGTRYSRLP